MSAAAQYLNKHGWTLVPRCDLICGRKCRKKKGCFIIAKWRDPQSPHNLFSQGYAVRTQHWRNDAKKRTDDP